MTLPKKQLWVVEQRDDKNVLVKMMYVFADRWFDVREAGGMELRTGGDYSCLFISAVMAPESVDIFREEKGLIGVFEVQYHGNASSGTLSKKIVRLKKSKK